MIYNNDASGTFMIKTNLKESKTIELGYKVDGVNKVGKVKHTELPNETKRELAKLTNKIARFIEERA